MNFVRTTDWLLWKLQQNCNVDFKSGQAKPQEERRVCWTTYANINCLFDNWEQFLVDYGFGTIQESGKIEVSDEQRARILNLDESALSLDGSTQKRGGHPTVRFYDGSLPVIGMIASNSSQCSTLITGSTATGEVLPPHFQFLTAAKSDE